MRKCLLIRQINFFFFWRIIIEGEEDIGRPFDDGIRKELPS